METTIVYWGYTGVMENKMETTPDLIPTHEMKRILAKAIADWDFAKTTSRNGSP